MYPPFNFLHGLVVLGEMGSDSGSDSAEKGEKIGKGGKTGLDSVCELKEKTIWAYQLLCSSLIEGDCPQQYNLVGC